MKISFPRIIFAGLRGNSGKTFLSVGIVAYWQKKGRSIAPFKKGPDYIDSAWLGVASGRPCHNLDTFLMKKKGALASFSSRACDADGAVVEGNRGLYDGMDARGTYSTAELAKLLQSPLILVVDCTMATRTVAAMVLGCQKLDPEVAIEGVLLNRIGGSRHESIVRSAIEANCNIPVLGAVPKIKGKLFPERYMGLVPPQEHPRAKEAINKAAKIAEGHIDVEKVWEIACDAPTLETSAISLDFGFEEKGQGKRFPKRPRIGVVRDSAFWFYYPDNLEELQKLGAEIVECDAIFDKEPPEVDALFIGGGFPETHAEKLAANVDFLKWLRQAIERGLPVYAECGGMMYLSEKLIIRGKTFPMAGVLPLTFVLEKRPQRHGYTLLEVDQPNPYFPEGETLSGHEFHYSRITDWKKDAFPLVFKVKRGNGIHERRDGICYKSVLATYSHIHAIGTKSWAKGLVDRAILNSQKLSNATHSTLYNEQYGKAIS